MRIWGRSSRSRFSYPWQEGTKVWSWHRLSNDPCLFTDAQQHHRVASATLFFDKKINVRYRGGSSLSHGKEGFGMECPSGCIGSGVCRVKKAEEATGVIGDHLSEMKRQAEGIISEINAIALMPGSTSKHLVRIEERVELLKRLVRVSKELDDRRNQ